MRAMHLYFEGTNEVQSGANLRDAALRDGLSRIANVQSICLQDRYYNANLRPPATNTGIVAQITPEIVRDILEQVAAFTPDVVLVEGIWLMQLVPGLQALGVHVIVDMHNVESRLLRDIDLARAAPGMRWLVRLRKGRRWARAAAAERALAQMADSVWVCAEDDADALMETCDLTTRPAVVPNPAPAVVLPCGEGMMADPTAEGPRILFVGHLGYRPNIGAVRALSRDILPGLRTTFPSANLVVCGRAPHRQVKQDITKSPGAELVEGPADLGPYYAASDMTVIPLTEGGGTRIKVLEAFVAGLPVIASGRAVSGLGLTPGREYLRAETPEECIAAVAELCGTPDRARKLSERASEFIRRHHGPACIPDAVSEALKTARMR